MQTITTQQQTKATALAVNHKGREAFVAFSASQRHMGEEDAAAWATVLASENEIANIESAVAVAYGTASA